MKPERVRWIRIGVGFAFVHFVVTLVFAFLAIAYDAHGNWPDRPWNQMVAIAVWEFLCFPAKQISAGIGGEAELFLLPLNSILFGVVSTAMLFVLRASAPWRRATAVLAFCLIGSSASASLRQTVRESTVGIPARITDLVLPGSELEVLPQDAKTPVVLRITRVAPHGTEFRYDIEWTGLDVGHHDLRAFLRRKDGTDVSNLPEIGVDVRTVLGPGLVKPNHPPEHEVPHFGGYRAWMIAIGVAWAIGLVAILSMFRKKRAEDQAARARPKTLAERLRPLVESAMRGTLSSAERAQLELGLVAYWRRRLDLDDERPDAALAALRLHAEAGPLLNQLDAWLYKPGTSGTVDVAALLAPYKDLPPDAIDIELALAAGRR